MLPKQSGQLYDFYPRSPCGERREYWVGGYGTANNFYPRSPCGERRGESNCAYLPGCISIHALLAESDIQLDCRQQGKKYFYPRSPCGERPAARQKVKPGLNISIHALLAESDRLLQGFAKQISHFYPRSPCGERHQAAHGLANTPPHISIHALLAESDTVVNNIVFVPGEFLSTLSLRRATLFSRGVCRNNQHFYPRSPCGERLTVHQ